MYRLRRIAVLVALAGGTGIPAVASPDLPIELFTADGQGEIEMDSRTGEATAANGVIVKYYDGQSRHVTLQAQKVRVERDTYEVSAEGDVTILATEDIEGQVPRSEFWRGRQIHYNLRTRAFSASEFRIAHEPFFIAGEEITGAATNSALHELSEVTLATEDLAKPASRFRARSVRLVPGEYLETTGMGIYLGNTRVLLLPKYRRSLRRHTAFWTLTPGYRSLYGPFALSTFHWMVQTNLEAGFDLDLRQKRGVGFGPRMEYDLGRIGQGDGRYYFIHDNNPPPPPDGGSPTPSDRYRYDFNHAVTNLSGFSAQGALRGQSDAWILRDFFESEYRRNPRPQSFFEATQTWPNYSLDLLARAQVNDFFETTERLPEVRFTALRQQIGAAPLYYESESSAGYFHYRSGVPGGPDYSGARADTYHQVVAPKTLFGWLNVAPRVGGRFTYYTDPAGSPLSDRDRSRGVFNTGAEVSLKASRTWAGASNRTLDVSGLRHLLEPSINYVFVPEPSPRPYDLPQYDSELPSLRLRPVDFPDYREVDSVDSQNTIRFAVQNRLQTKRRELSVDLVRWAMMMDWRLHPERRQTTFPELYSTLDFVPREWLILANELRYDINAEHWREAIHRITFQPGNVWQWTFGHRYLRDGLGIWVDPELARLRGLSPEAGNNLFFSSLYLRVNENWAFRMNHHFEARDGVLEEQSYTLYRDFRSWTGALTLRLRDNRRDVSDWAVVATFSLKAFPRFRLHEDRDRMEKLFGG
ncbi:MAG: LPS-assembly protein LptD [Pedosphaera sp.]|nr:LPS-assembly protein LptD [Pedosphaera sp.]